MQWLIPHIASSDRVSSVWSSREFLYDSDSDLLYYGDGATLGGVSLATGGGGGVAAVSGTNGSFTYSTLTVGALNGITFYTSNGSLVASYDSTQFQQSSLMTNYLGTTYTSHTHSQYLNTSQSSLFQQTSNTSNITSNAFPKSQSTLFEQTSLMTNYLGTAATQSFRFTSNDSQLLFTSQSSLFQATSDNSLSLGTTYTSHTHSQYINTSQSSLFQQTSNTSNITSNALNTSQSSLFQQTSLMSDYLGTGATQSFRFTSNDSQLLFTSQSSLFQATSDNSLSLGITYTSHTHSQYVNTSQSSLFQQTSLMSDYLGTGATQSFRFTSNDSQLLFTSQSSLFQATSDNSLSLGTTYTSHTHSQYVNTSQSSLFQQTSLMSNYLGTTASINDLADVVVSSATLGQALVYNGANWINADLGTGVGAGNGVILYFDATPSGISTYETIAPAPDSDPEVDEVVTVNNNTVLIHGYANPTAIGRTTIDAGAWDFNVYTYVSNTTPSSYLVFEVYSRTSGGTETLLFTVQSDPITFTTIQGMNFTSVQPAYSVNSTDYLVIKVYGKTTATTNIDVHFVHSGTVHYSHVHTPLAPLHNDLGGLQGGASNEYFHLNSNDYLNRNVSATSVYQLLANSSLSLGTTYTSHTHSQYINTSESSLFQQTSNTSAITSNALNTSQSSLFEQTSHTTVFLTSQSNQAFSAANGSQAFQTLRFVDGQGVSFSTDTNGINASVKTDYLTTAMASDAGSRFVNTSAALNLTNISATFSSNAISLSVAAPTGVTYLGGIAASNTTYTSGNVSLRDLNGITFQSTTGQGIQITHALQYTSNTSAITASALNTSQSSLFQQTSNTSIITASALNTSQSSLFQQTSNTSAITSNALHTSLSTRFAGTGTTTAGTNISLSMTLNSVGLNLAASVNPGGGGGGIALANSQTTYTSGTVNLSAAGALTIQSTTGQSYQFSVPATSSLSGTGQLSISVNGSTVSLGVPYQAVSGTNGSFSYSTLSFGALNGITFYTSNSSIVASYTTASAAPSPVIISAGTSSASLGSIVFSDANGVQFGLSGSTITANAGASPRSFYNPYGDLVMVAGQVGQGTLNINPNVMPSMTFDRVLLPINNTNAANSSGSHTLSFWLGIYTLNVSTLSLVTSNSVSYALTHSGNAGSYSLYSGMRHVSIPMSTSLSEGRYFIGVLSRTTSGGANGSYSQFQVSNLNSNFLGFFGSSHNTTMQFQPGIGVYSVTTAGIPGTIPISQLRGSDSAAQRPPVVVFANSTL